MIEIENLTVRFGGVVALNDITINLAAPICAVIGPNGAGKTTFLNVLSGFVQPTSGTIRAFGQDLLAMAPHKRTRWGLRRSFQKEQVVDQLTVHDNVAVVLDPLGLPTAKRRDQLAAALEFTGLTGLAHRKAGGLTAYERRMTEIARCLVGHPQVVLLDEPGAGFSQTEVERLKKVIQGIHDFDGAVTLLIDHDVDLIRATCPETMVLDFGRLVAHGQTLTVLEDDHVRAVYLGVEEIE